MTIYFFFFVYIFNGDDEPLQSDFLGDTIMQNDPHSWTDKQSENTRNIQINSDSIGLKVTIETKNLVLTSVGSSDVDNLYQLFSNKTLMGKYATGKTRDKDYCKKRLATWMERRKQGDIFHGLIVKMKHNDKFIGLVVLGHGDRPGVSEVAGLGLPDYWNQGYGKEAFGAMVTTLVPECIKRKMLLDGKPLCTIQATAREDNEASVKILTHYGFKKGVRCKAYDDNQSVRYSYSLQVAELQLSARLYYMTAFAWHRCCQSVQYVPRPIKQMLVDYTSLNEHQAQVVSQTLVVTGVAVASTALICSLRASVEIEIEEANGSCDLDLTGNLPNADPQNSITF